MSFLDDERATVAKKNWPALCHLTHFLSVIVASTWPKAKWKLSVNMAEGHVYPYKKLLNVSPIDLAYMRAIERQTGRRL
jgi:hypothetical protein